MHLNESVLTSTSVFSCQFYEIFQRNFAEHLWQRLLISENTEEKMFIEVGSGVKLTTLVNLPD